MCSSLHFWDICLIIGVCAQTTAFAYLHKATHKALVYTLPIPFTLGALAVGRPIDATNVTGLMLLLLYTQAVRVLHVRFRWPIVAAIVMAIVLYSAVAFPLAQILPGSEAAFWAATLCSMAVGAVVLNFLPPRDEPGHRTPMPVWLKIPIIAVVVISLVLLKQWLHGFMTVFPMVGVVGAYEARHSLWTMGRQIPILLLTVTPLMITCHIAQHYFAMPLALALGWIVFGIALMLVTLLQKRAAKLVES